MVLTIIALTPQEEYLQQLDPDLCEIKETIEKGGLRTITFDYKFQDIIEDKELFKIGNKLWIQGDINLTDAVYVINTEVKQDMFKENSFTFDAEEVLVELTNAPFVSHLDLTTYSSVFKTRTTNGAQEVKVDWNSLNHWFGQFFNLGVVQDCLNSNLQWIPFFGTYNRMNLLRYIEEQTGNVFVTRYEKDSLSNVIHRYLDFLNPINVSKNWELHLEYDFAGTYTRKFYDSNMNETTEDKPWEVVRYTNSHVPTGQSETVLNPTYDATRDEANNQYDTLDTSYTWDTDDEMVEDEDTKREYNTYTNIIPSNVQFQICTPNGKILNADGTIYTTGDDNPLLWSCSDIGLTTNNTNCLITLFQTGNTLGLTLNNRTFAVISDLKGGDKPTYVSYNNTISENATTGNKREDSILPDDCYLEIYDHVADKILFRTCVNRSIGTVHSEVLDFGFNIDNIQYDVDESDVYSSVAPVLQYDEGSGTGNDMTRADFTDLVTRYMNLSIHKGQKIPMILQKVSITAATDYAAKEILGNYNSTTSPNEAVPSANGDYDNYWVRPYKPQDQANSSDETQNKWEFIRGTAYWYAPYDKAAGSLEVSLTDKQGINYPTIYGRNDTRDDKGTYGYNKTGTTESSDADIFSIYNQCALYLKQHSTPKVELNVDVSNLQGGQYNNYDIHDKVYIKLPETSELITATVVETTKEANNIAANTIKLSNYTTNTLKQITNETIIHASNLNFKYPSSKTLQVRLENLAHDSQDPYSIQYLGNKLLSFTLYSVENGQRTFKKSYSKTTDIYGYAKLAVKLSPGEYVIEINFGGDEEYSETTSTVKVSVGGTKETKKKTTNTTKNKTTKKTTKKVTKTTYYDKYGRSPDKKKILAIGRPSASGDEGEYTFYGMEFKNVCPMCGRKETLYWSIFYAGNEHSDYGKFPATGRWEGGSAEGHIFCKACDADYSCQGREHGSSGKRLTVTKKRFKSTKSDAYKLKKGKYVYNKVETKNTQKNNTSTKTRKIIGSPSRKVKNLALSIVDNKTGYKAMRAICDWMDKNIHYTGYNNFVRSPDRVISSKHGNCCDQTRLLLQLFDSAGLTEYYDLYYVHVQCPSYGHVYARVKSKKTGKWTNIDPASDAYGCYGYVCDSCSRTASPKSKYPNMPF